MHLMTFHVASYVLMTARSAIGAQEFIFKLNCRSHVTRNVYFSENNDHDVHLLDIMVDTYSGQTVSPLSGLNRTNDNILLYNPLHCTARTC